MISEAELAQMKERAERTRRGEARVYEFAACCDDVPSLIREVEELRAALRLAAVRLEILTGRMRACHEETGKHELLDEAEMFCAEARAALGEKP